MFLKEFFAKKKKCSHKNVLPNIEISYCPDCGNLIQNEWYITRCGCCGIKLVTKIHNELITPTNRFCTNCGSNEFIIERIKNINFIDINYAILIKKEVQSSKKELKTQCWQERTSEQQKLLIQYQ